MKRHSLRTAITCTLAASLIAGCAQFPPVATSTATVENADRCSGLNQLSDAEVSVRLDLAPLIFGKLRAATGKTNEQVCAMAEAEVNKVMLADRNKYRNPDRKAFRAPAKDFMRQWDADDQGRLPSATQVLAAESARKEMAAGKRRSGVGDTAELQAAGISASQWTPLGPGNIGGRIRGIVIDPRNQNRLFIGASTGGIWLSENAGQSFTAVADFMGNLAIGALAMDPSNPNVMYAGTGESYTGLAGIGMYKSTDGGITWSFLASTTSDTAVNTLGNEWGGVNRIAISPANPNLVLAATTRGSNLSQGAIMRSTDGGNSWTRIQLAPGTVVTTNPPNVLDLKFDPNNPSNMVAGTENGHVYTSRDAGATWTQGAALISAAVGRSATARAELAYAKTIPNLVFMSLDNGPSSTGSRGEIWKSEDGGITWTKLSSPAHLGDQGDYDNALWVDPTNENHIVTGGLDLYQSMDAGANFTRVSTWQQAGPAAPQPHADHHVIVSVPNFGSGNPIVYFGNDGGLYRANNIFSVSANGTSSWQNLNNGLAVTQFYSGAGKRAAGGKIIGGTQDNGTLIYGSGTNWDRFAGGDGGFVAVDPTNDATVYGEYVYASIHRTISLNARAYICAGITEALKNTDTNTYCGANNTEAANFIAPFILDPNNNLRMLVGANSLWVSNNVRDPVPTWSVIKAPVAPVATGDKPYISAVAVAEKDSNIIWTGHNSSGSTTSQVWKTTNGLSASPNWQRVGSGVLPTSTVNRITIDPDNPNRVWVVYSGFSSARIWTTTDGGTTWSNIHSNLPNVTLHDMKRHPAQPNWLYVASANGIYTSENSGQTWNTSNDGPASVRVRELFWYDNSTLVAATYGRGMFRATVAGSGPLNYSDLWWGGTAENGWGMTVQQHGNVQFNVFFVYDGTGKPIWYAMPGGSWNADYTVFSGGLAKPTSSPLKNYNPAQFSAGSQVGTMSITYTSANTATLNYVINGISGQKSIQRQSFGPVDNTPGLQVGDMWWGGNAQNGWGVSITQQYRTLFAAWYTYDANGNVTWYTLPGGTWSGNTYSGTLATATSSPWLGGIYNPAAFTPVAAGTVSFNFSDANNAVMSYTFTSGPFAGTTETKTLTRQPY